MAARYFINGGVNSNWSTSGNWSATDGGGASGVKPTASDDVHFSSNSPNCTVDTAGVGLSIDFTGAPGSAYASTITMTAGLTISGSVTLTSGMTIAGSGGLTISTSATLTSNGKTWPNALTLTGTGAATYTLADNWVVDGLFNPTAGNPTTLNGFQFTLNGGMTINNTNGTALAGTTNLIFAGTGTINLSSASVGYVNNNITFNTSNPSGYTFSGANFRFNNGYGDPTLTHIAGVVNASSTTLISAPNTSTIYACSGITWGGITLSLSTGNRTHTLNENLNSSGLVTLGITSNTTNVNGSAINAGGGLRNASTSGVVTGTTVINVNGTGTLDGPSATTGYINNPITISAGSGRVTISPTFRILLNQLLYTSGSIVTSSSPSITWGSGPRRVMRLFEGFKIKLISGRLKIQQK